MQRRVSSFAYIDLPENYLLQIVTVLLVSATVNETLATRSFLRPIDDRDVIYSFDQDGGQIIYYIGKYGACPAAVVKVPHGFEEHISTLANECFPNLCAIVSVGIGYGIIGKVQMFDVLVSSQVVNYDKSLDELWDEPFTVSPWLNRLFSQTTDWPGYVIKRLTDNGIPVPNVMSGVILSGLPYDADDLTINAVRKFAGEAIGIEMQKTHLFTKNIANVIIVKAVCDFGVGKDNEKYQPTAALLAADLVHRCLSDDQAYKNLRGLHNVIICLVKCK